MTRLLFCILTIFSAAFAQASPLLDSNNQIPIPIKKDKDNGISSNTKPLSLRDHIEAYYYNGVVTIVFDSEIDSANVLIWNHNATESWHEYITDSNIAIIHISDDEGFYEINITIGNDEYFGYFII